MMGFLYLLWNDIHSAIADLIFIEEDLKFTDE
jgi:hypothetical protein